MKTQTKQGYQLLVNFQETNLVLDQPIYSISKLKKYYPGVKKGDSIWYKDVEFKA